MPIRFTSPVIGGQGDVYLQRHTWQVGVAYRRLVSDQFVIGSHVRNDLGPNGAPTRLKSNAFTISLAYGLSDRLSLTLNAPYAQASHSRLYADLKSHGTSIRGLGDANLIATLWLRHTGLQPRGNLAISFGAKAPTGTHSAGGYFWKKSGDSIPFPLDQSIQPGDGGWGLIFQVQGFQPILPSTYLYAAGSYLASLRTVTEVPRDPPGGVFSAVYWAVPDTYYARAGVVTAPWPGMGLTLSLGARLDGTTKGDLIGGRDEGYRRPAVVGYVDPGVSFTRGSRTLALDVPVRAYMRFRWSYADIERWRFGGGGLARYLILASFSQRF